MGFFAFFQSDYHSTIKKNLKEVARALKASHIRPSQRSKPQESPQLAPLPGPTLRPFPVDLPLDLCRYIFELAARHDPRTASELLLVSRLVHIWIKPVMYCVVLLDSPTRLSRIMRRRTMKNVHGDVHDLGRYVKAVGVKVREACQTTAFLSACPNIKHLACWSDSDLYLSLIKPSFLHLRPHSLSLSLSPVFDVPDFQDPFFSEITHLHILDSACYWRKWDAFHMMPSLTHLAFSCISFHPDTFECLKRLLRDSPNLRQLVLLTGPWFRGPVGVDRELLGDIRVVFVQETDPMADWKDFAMGGDDNMWAYAEKITALRRWTWKVKALPKTPDMQFLEDHQLWSTSLYTV
ncbi:hypothetical protein BDN72DRAFT_893040 [Pluteus cervinus]|uniref:Uncharacterized protein n=1 Tax=Pluteus cervinus TaxID=181527 RepID=A0ACD3B9H7_9AGAR|nr:hypothetical protein BDN72DRAFT_893040 [Pluteus cervinus]